MGPSTCFCREYCIASPIFCGAHVLQLAVKAISRLLRDTSIGEARFGKRAVFSFWHCSLGGFQALCLWNFFFFVWFTIFLKVFYLSVCFTFSFFFITVVLLFSYFRFFVFPIYFLFNFIFIFRFNISCIFMLFFITFSLFIFLLK